MRPNAILTLATLAITLFATATAGLAQQPDADQGPPAGMGMMGGGMMGRGVGDGMMGMMGGGCPMMGMMGRNGDAATFAEGRIAFVKAELAITEAQKDVWEAYATALRKNLASMQQMRATMMGATADQSRRTARPAYLDDGVAASNAERGEAAAGSTVCHLERGPKEERREHSHGHGLHDVTCCVAA